MRKNVVHNVFTDTFQNEDIVVDVETPRGWYVLTTLQFKEKAIVHCVFSSCNEISYTKLPSEVVGASLSHYKYEFRDNSNKCTIRIGNRSFCRTLEKNLDLVNVNIYKKKLDKNHYKSLITIDVVFQKKDAFIQECAKNAISSSIVSCNDLGFIICNLSKMNSYAKQHGENPNILEKFTTTEDGNDLMSQGAVLPVLGIHAWTYRLVFIHEKDRWLCKYFGSKVIDERFYLIDASPNNIVDVVDGYELEQWTGHGNIVQIHGIESGWYCLSAYSSGRHGEEWLPTFVFELQREERELSEPLINIDPTIEYEKE